MVKQGTNYYNISRPDSTTKFVFEVKEQSSKTMWKADRYTPDQLRFTLCGSK